MIGSTAVMKRQLERLVEKSKEPRVSIQILPFTAGAHPAISGSFVYLEFDNDDDPDLLFVENPLGDSLINNDPELTAKYRERFWDLEDQATPAADLEKFLAAHVDL